MARRVRALAEAKSFGATTRDVWADSVFLQARMEGQGKCVPVLIGATPESKKELIASRSASGESVQSWRELLIDVKRRGLQSAPEIAVGDSALGLEGARRGLSVHGTSDLGTQGRQRPGQGPALGAGHHEEGSARGLLRAELGVRRSGDRRLRREIPGQVRPGG